LDGPILYQIIVKKLTCFNNNICWFYSASSSLSMQTAVTITADLSVRPSVGPSIRHIPVFCRDEWRYDRAVFNIR